MNTTTITINMLEKLDHKKQVAFAVFCAKQVEYLVKEEHKLVVRKAIEAAEGFVFGNVSKDECRAAANDATYAAADVAHAAHAASAAARAADAAAYASDYAADVAHAAHAASAAARAADAATFTAAAARFAVYASVDDVAAFAEQIRYYEELLNFDSLIENSLFTE
jgi:hypothetical protein